MFLQFLQEGVGLPGLLGVQGCREPGVGGGGPVGRLLAPRPAQPGVAVGRQVGQEMGPQLGGDVDTQTVGQGELAGQPGGWFWASSNLASTVQYKRFNSSVECAPLIG